MRSDVSNPKIEFHIKKVKIKIFEVYFVFEEFPSSSY